MRYSLLFLTRERRLTWVQRLSFSRPWTNKPYVCVTVYKVLWHPGPRDRSGHSGQWHSSRAPDASWASGVKNASRPDPLRRRWMERPVRSPVDEWSDLSCQRRSTKRLQYQANTCVCIFVCICVMLYYTKHLGLKFWWNFKLVLNCTIAKCLFKRKLCLSFSCFTF